jgi:SAM-dependent methyltransferase
MDRLSKVTNKMFGVLPSSVRVKISSKPILMQAQKRYLNSQALHIDNKLYWEKFVEGFEKNKLYDDDLHPFINSLLNRLVWPACSVIEYGCGIGRAAGIIRARGFRDYLGVDIAQRAVDLAKERNPEMEFCRGDILNFTAPKLFNAAIATDVLLYLSPEHQIQALLNMKRSLTKGAPILMRWAPGLGDSRRENDISIKNQNGNHPILGDIKGWVLLVTPDYINNILEATELSLIQPIDPKPSKINKNTKYERLQPYLLVFAKNG